MAFKMSTKTFQLPQAETQLGVIARVVGLGSQVNAYYEAGVKKYEEDKAAGIPSKKPEPFKQMIQISFELPNDLISSGEYEGKPLMISKDFELKFGEYKGRKSGLLSLVTNALKRDLTLEEKSGKFDFKSLLGKSVLLQIKHVTSKGGKVYANIESIIKSDSRQAPALVSDPIYVDDDTPLSEVEELRLAQWTKDKIVAGRVGNVASKLPEDDKPF